MNTTHQSVMILFLLLLTTRCGIEGFFFLNWPFGRRNGNAFAKVIFIVYFMLAAAGSPNRNKRIVVMFQGRKNW